MRKTRSVGSIKKPSPLQQQTHKLEEKFEFINKNYSKYLKCAVCSLLFINPVRLHPCAHTFCEKCVGKGGCPTCKKKAALIQPDLIGIALINEMIVRCLNDGCPYRGTFEEYKKYHGKDCKLKHGLQNWLKEMHGTLNENSNQIAKFRHSSEEQSPFQRKESNEKQKLILPKRLNIPNRDDAIQDEDLLAKHLKTDL